VAAFQVSFFTPRSIHTCDETKQGGFLFWYSAYFSVCVWIAIYLMRGPGVVIKRVFVNCWHVWFI